MPEDKYINVKTTVNTTVTAIEIFSEYVDSDLWILATGYWEDENIWIDDANWID